MDERKKLEGCRAGGRAMIQGDRGSRGSKDGEGWRGKREVIGIVRVERSRDGGGASVEGWERESSEKEGEGEEEVIDGIEK